MNGFLKLLLGLFIVAAILFGVYQVLPEFSHNVIYSVYQNKFDSEAKAQIDEVKGLMNPKLEADYQTILESNTDTKGWVYSKITKAVTFYGNKVQLDLKDVPGEDGKYFDNTVVKVVFTKNAKDEWELEVYVNSSSTPESDEARAIVLKQLLYGIES